MLKDQQARQVLKLNIWHGTKKMKVGQGCPPPHKISKTAAFLSALWYPKRYIHRSATSPEKFGQVSKQSRRIWKPHLSPTPSTHYYYSQVTKRWLFHTISRLQGSTSLADHGVSLLPLFPLGAWVPPFFLFTRRERGRGFYVSFPGDFFSFFPCLLAQKTSFVLLHKLNCRNKYTYLLTYRTWCLK